MKKSAPSKLLGVKRKGNRTLGREPHPIQRGPLSEDAIARVVKKYAAWAQLDGVTPHVLRHAFSYAYLDKTQNDLVGLADILGHDNLATTQIYTQKPLGVLQDTVEKVRYF